MGEQLSRRIVSFNGGSLPLILPYSVRRTIEKSIPMTHTVLWFCHRKRRLLILRSLFQPSPQCPRKRGTRGESAGELAPAGARVGVRHTSAAPLEAKRAETGASARKPTWPEICAQATD